MQGTAHHSVLSHRSSLSQSVISREALALPLADTDTLILVPDAVTTRSPLCTQTNAESAEVPEIHPRLIPRRRRKCRRHVEIRNTSIMTGILSILLIVALSICACTILMSSQKTQANMQKTWQWLSPESTIYPPPSTSV
jgi:hypothetical protein